MAWPPHWQDAHGSVLVLPDTAWTRRVPGCLANELANAQRQHAHAVLNPHGTGTGAYAVSVRAPLALPSGADALCRQFGGGGRARAAGIDGLPADDLERFFEAFASTRWGDPGLTPYVVPSVGPADER